MADLKITPAPDPGALSGCCCPLMFCVMTRTHPWIERISDRFFEVSFDAAFRRMVERYLKRTGMSARAFGLALGDKRLVSRLRKGCAVRLDTADKALAYMGEPGLRALFLQEIEAYLKITGTKAYVLGLEAVGNRSFVPMLREGLSPYLGTIDEVRAWMGAHSTVAERRSIGAETLHKSWLGVGTHGGRAAGKNGEAPGESWYLNTEQTATYLNMGRRTLDRMRVDGDGPPFYKFGQGVRYRIDELHAWTLTRRRLSTSDDGTGQEIPTE